MIDEIDLDAAAAKGLIGEDQAIALRNFAAEQAAMPLASQEKFQLASSLADVTRAIGFALILFCTPMGFMSSIGFQMRRLRSVDTPADWYIPAPVFFSVAIWCLLIAGIFFFLRRYRHVIRSSPATMAALMVGGTFVLVMTVALIGQFVDVSREIFQTDAQRLEELSELMRSGSYSSARETRMPAFSMAVAVSAFLFFFWRATRFPPTLAFACLMLIFCASVNLPNFSTRGSIVDYTVVNWAAVIAAIPVFLLALWFDLTDIRRETWRSQVAFWLHIVAGAVFSRGYFGLASGHSWAQLNFFGISSAEGMLAVLLCVVIAFMISLTLDRRAMLMSLAIPFAASMGVMGLVFVGGLLVLASFKWMEWRVKLLARLPAKLVAQLPRTDLVARGQRPTRRHKELSPRTVR